MNSTANLQLRFDGPELQAHEMDVTLLAPSLLAFGEMCEQANRILNGNEVKVTVLLKADVKANCVTIDLSIIFGIPPKLLSKATMRPLRRRYWNGLGL